MTKDYSEEVKSFISKYKKEDIVFGKDIDFLLKRVEITKEVIEDEIMKFDNLSFAKKQIKDGETRYSLFFIYSKRKGRQYVVTFRDEELRIITIFPLGRRTIRRYMKKGLNIRGN